MEVPVPNQYAGKGFAGGKVINGSSYLTEDSGPR